MKSVDVLERWKISKLINLLEDKKFTKLPHQRPLTLKKNSSKRFIDSALNNKLLQNFIFADLHSSYNSSKSSKEKKFFLEYLNKNKEYSIEDCQHRMASLQLITNDDFSGEFEGRMEEFYNSEVPVLILKERTKEEVISGFGEVNGGKTVTNDNLIWGIDNTFNGFIKEKFIGDVRLLRLYKTKKNSDYVKRTLYGNILKIIKVCSSNDGIIESSNTGAESMMSFIKNDNDVNSFNYIVCLFDQWFNFIKDKPTKDSFTTQSNLFFIIHILNKKNQELSNERIDSILFKSAGDTRSSAEKRYNNILNIVINEG